MPTPEEQITDSANANEQYAESASIEAKAIAIESNSLVLRTVESGELLHWPLNKINHHLEIGNSIMLTIQNGNTPDKKENIPLTAPSKTSEDEKRRLLERLLN